MTTKHARLSHRTALTAAVFLVLGAAAHAQVEILPGSATAGQALFEEKGCLGCHSVDGEGGSAAPDLALASARQYTPGLLASVMWNHAPDMWQRMEAAGSVIPDLSAAESADLFSYFYSRLYFSPEGDAERGREVFVDKNCARCHALTAGADADGVGPAIDAWARVSDPIDWAERMWNHAGGMYAEMERAGIAWPRLSSQEMVDLLVYLGGLPETGSAAAGFEPGEPELGEAVFTARCERCHSFGESLPDRVDLLRGAGPRNSTDYAAEMWNHAPRMRERAGDDALPGLEDGAMADLVAYLFAQRYFAEPGNAAAGERVFQTKQCALCHELERALTGAPDLTLSLERYSPITMTRALWTHGPGMLRTLEDRDLDWPVFEGAEMTDLIAFLNSRLAPLVAGFGGSAARE